jgi:drug/metabolite transporter (DMT)-like permease
MLSVSLRQRPFLRWENASSTRAIGWLAICVMTICGSTGGVFGKTLTNVLSPVTLVFLSEVVTAFFIMLSFGAVPTIQKLARLQKKDLIPMAAIGIFSSVLAPLLLFEGLHRTSVVNATLFGNAEMVFLTFLGVVVMKEAFHRTHLFSILTVITGLLFIIFRGFTQSIVLQPGDILLVLSALSYSIGDITFRKYLNHSDPHVVVLFRSLVAAVGLYMLAPALGVPMLQQTLSFPLIYLPVLLGFGFLSKFLNTFSFYEAMEHLPLQSVSLSMNLSTVGSITFAALFLHESLSWYHVIGGVLVIAGTLMLELLGVRPPEEEIERQLTHRRPRHV